MKKTVLTAVLLSLAAAGLSACATAYPRERVYLEGRGPWVPAHYDRFGAWVPGHYR